MGMFRNENKSSSALPKVLIDPEPKSLSLEWFYFKGVVDNGSTPNVSREVMQDSELLRKLNQGSTKRFLRFPQ